MMKKYSNCENKNNRGDDMMITWAMWCALEREKLPLLGAEL